MKSLTIILVISGTIAAPKGIKLFNLLQSQFQIILILSSTSKFFLTAPPSASDKIFDHKFYDKHTLIKHTTWAQKADLFLAYPASANLVAQLSHGLANNLANLVYLACNCLKIVQPAMNNFMFTSASVQRNIATLRSDGVTVLDPRTGPLACGGEGIGRAWEPTAMYRYVCQALKVKPIKL